MNKVTQNNVHGDNNYHGERNKMSNKIRGFYVALCEPLSDEDFEKVKSAVLMIRNVNVTEEFVDKPDIWLAEAKIRRELGQKLLQIIYPELND